MSVTLNKRAYAQAQQLIREHRCVLDQREAWTDHKPARTARKRFIEEHGLAAYWRWHLGEDDEQEEGALSRYKFPYGDFVNLHRCAVLAAEERAGQHDYTDIAMAAAHLHGMLDELMAAHGTKERQRVPSA
jgi:hypothetical protein